MKLQGRREFGSVFLGFRLSLRLLLILLALPMIGVTQNAAAPQPGAGPSEDSATEQLQQAVQNPVASLISVPQNNTNFAYGPYNRTQDVLIIQPVIPVKLSENWNLIARIIQPLVWQPYFNQNTGGEYGLGDMNPSFFLSPAKPGKLIRGVGYRAFGGCAGSASDLDDRRSHQQCLVRRRLGRPPAG
jgi:hypothetical protein